LKIDRIELQVIGPELKRYTWSHDLPEQFQSLTILRLFTDDGVEGVAGVWNAASYDYDRYTAESLRHLMPVMIGRDPRQYEKLLFDLRPRVFPLPPGAMSLIDIALLDIEGKLTNKPIHKVLGAEAASIKSYASTPMYDDIEAYMDKIEELLELGFTAIKFHTWCIIEDDLALANEARRRFPEMTFMLDAENNYEFEDGLKMAMALSELNFEWFEAPYPDHDIDAYRKITKVAKIPIVPSGNWIQDLSLFKECLLTKLWNRSRTDVTIMGGIRPALRAMQLSKELGMQCELMSWGYTLAHVANLHVMLAAGNCSYFEQSLPYELFEYGVLDTIRTDKSGMVSAPKKPGLGVEIDWNAMAARTVYSIICNKDGVKS
tara:strand:- start:1451 stop:2575 length:1125 start_codon:yes stop_codon:yes gene_type:complete